jgi:hypothetical protein
MASCMVCFDEFSMEKLPRLLSCNHTVCHSCVVRCFANPAGFSCPLDRKQAGVSYHRGARQFLFNYALLDHLGVPLPDDNKHTSCQNAGCEVGLELRVLHSVIAAKTEEEKEVVEATNQPLTN